MEPEKKEGKVDSDKKDFKDLNHKIYNYYMKNKKEEEKNKGIYLINKSDLLNFHEKINYEKLKTFIKEKNDDTKVESYINEYYEQEQNKIKLNENGVLILSKIEENDKNKIDGDKVIIDQNTKELLENMGFIIEEEPSKEKLNLPPKTDENINKEKNNELNIKKEEQSKNAEEESKKLEELKKQEEEKRKQEEELKKKEEIDKLKVNNINNENKTDGQVNNQKNERPSEPKINPVEPQAQQPTKPLPQTQPQNQPINNPKSEKEIKESKVTITHNENGMNLDEEKEREKMRANDNLENKEINNFPKEKNNNINTNIPKEVLPEEKNKDNEKKLLNRKKEGEENNIEGQEPIKKMKLDEINSHIEEQENNQNDINTHENINNQNEENKNQENPENIINTNENNINDNNNNINTNVNTNNNINPMQNPNEISLELMLQFQQFTQKYLKEHGGENDFINSYPYYPPTIDQDYLPEVKNGRIVLRTDIPSIGLQNIGATCYMNATLECLIHIKELSELLLSAFYFRFPKENENYSKEHKLSIQFVNILSQVYFPKLHGNNNKFYAPYDFKNLISEMNPLFAGVQANDAKDLLQFILENIHSELKQAQQVFIEYIIDQRNEQMAMKYFYDSYISQNKSPVHDFLYGVNKIESKCLNCQTIKYNYQSYNLLYFPLKEAKRCVVEKKKKEDPNFNGNNYTLVLEDCFTHNEKIEKFVGDNQMYCNDCFQLADAEYQSSLYTTPNILSIVLNRGKDNLDFTEDFIFGTELDITKYIHNPNVKHGKYYLIGTVVHSGPSNMGGHFIAYCRMDKHSKWFCYNDAWVYEENNFEEVMFKNSPYILFYHYDNEYIPPPQPQPQPENEQKIQEQNIEDKKEDKKEENNKGIVGDKEEKENPMVVDPKIDIDNKKEVSHVESDNKDNKINLGENKDIKNIEAHDEIPEGDIDKKVKPISEVGKTIKEEDKITEEAKKGNKDEKEKEEEKAKDNKDNKIDPEIKKETSEIPEKKEEANDTNNKKQEEPVKPMEGNTNQQKPEQVKEEIADPEKKNVNEIKKEEDPKKENKEQNEKEGKEGKEGNNSQIQKEEKQEKKDEIPKIDNADTKIEQKPKEITQPPMKEEEQQKNESEDKTNEMGGEGIDKKEKEKKEVKPGEKPNDKKE